MTFLLHHNNGGTQLVFHNWQLPNVLLLSLLNTNLSFSRQMYVQVDKRANNQWKQNYFVLNFPKGACSTLRVNSRDFYRVMFKLDPDLPGPCVIPAVSIVAGNTTTWRSHHLIPIPSTQTCTGLRP